MSTLADRARESATERDEGEWGYRLTLDPGAVFEGRWRGETVSTGGEYGAQRVFLLYDRDGALCHIYGKARLARKVDALNPVQGDNVAVFRGDDEYANGRTIHAYGLATEPNSAPLPEPPDAEPAAPPAPVQDSFGDEPPW